MPAPYPDQQRRAHKRLEEFFGDPAHGRIVHYSCESFDDRVDGRSPRITSIAVRRLDSGATESFSIHHIAERTGIGLAQIEAHYDTLEREMLQDFYNHVSAAGEVTYAHWNMRDANYGFAAIEHRYKVLGGCPIDIAEHRRLDLSPTLLDIYGTDYIGNPRLLTLAAKNEITQLRALSGADEAAAFARKDYVALHQSTLRKVDILHSIAERAHRGTLKTDTSWWDLHGGNARAAWGWLVSNKTVAFFLVILFGIVGIYFVFRPPVH